ncbi:intermembrane lipid transfer protein VPS13B [Vanessa tameamea]|uniref:Intermembrane lipid transfer protein VPS13B n=1 Tax=Vanessa tameamea TaxID=334116 RepID=A0ABM4AYJ2_VANTA
MFNIESYVTPILLSYVDKYVRDFKPANAQVSLWAGGVTLHNLVLKADVLQKEVALPFTLLSGRIHQLLIQVPWTKIMSEPIVVTIDTIECILSLNPPAAESTPWQAHRSQVVDTPPGYMQALVRRIVSNIAVRVNSLIVKYVHDDIVLSLNVKRLSIDSVGVNWEPAFADIDQNQPAIRRIVRLDDLTLCLDRADSDGKIRFFYEPLLYRCQMDIRVLTRLVSANTRRARSLCVELLCKRLAWGLNGDQLVLLLRLLRERAPFEVHLPSPIPKQLSIQPAPIHATSSNTAEPTHTNSWSAWAWSWMPIWNNEGIGETPAPAGPVPVSFTAHFGIITVLFKVAERHGTVRKRARSILELNATDVVIKSFMCSPTLFRLNCGARTITFAGHGKCVCGHTDINGVHDEARIFLSKIEQPDEQPWSWVDEELNEQIVEATEAVEEKLEEYPEELQPQAKNLGAGNRHDAPKAEEEEMDQFWIRMAPVLYLEYSHERSPANQYENPYHNPPSDFQYSDWVEECSMKVLIRPMLCNVSTGLFHRVALVKSFYDGVLLPPPVEIAMRKLTVEECDALTDNLPLRHAKIDITGFRVRFIPTNHSQSEVPLRPPLIIDVQIPTTSMTITSPLYPHRVCSAACQLEDGGSLLRASRLYTSIDSTIQVGVCTLNDEPPRPCARIRVRFLINLLLHRKYFEQNDIVHFGITIRIREANVSGSAARLQAAYQVAQSLCKGNYTDHLRHTTVVNDALHDDDYVAVNISLEELLLRRFVTTNINTHTMTLNSIKATAFQSPVGGELKQVWLLSAPEDPTSTPYLKASCQCCMDPSAVDAMEYLNISVKPTALSFDPMLVTWMSYRSKMLPIPQNESIPQNQSLKNVSSSQYLSRRRVTPPSSGRGASHSGSGAELVHMRTKSVDSSSEKSEKKEPIHSPQESQETEVWWKGVNLLHLHERLKSLLIGVEVSLIQIYVSSTSVSSLDSVTLRDAMERHVTTAHRVFVISVGRLLLESNPQSQNCWANINFDRPTFQRPRRDTNAQDDSFPWKALVTDMSCYTLQVRPGTERSGREKSMSGLRSQLKPSRVLVPQTVLESNTTSITVSVVTKNLIINTGKKSEPKPKRHDHNRDEDKTKYFMTGSDFKPSSLKEFIRGPAKRGKLSPEPGPSEPNPDSPPDPANVTTGPIISLGVHLHADTPPIIVRLEQDQVQTVAIAMHCFAHIMSLLRRPPVTVKPRVSSFGSTNRSLTRSISEVEPRPSVSEETPSENPSEQLISIFEAKDLSTPDVALTTSFWFQWVVSRATLLISSSHVKLAFDIEDAMVTVDVQEKYNQLKMKIVSASVRHYRRTSNTDWVPGVLGGRVLEIREPTHANAGNQFFTVTVTQALIEDLPDHWRDDFHPKLIEYNILNNVNTMWEVYGTLAPLEAVLQPDILDNIITWVSELTPHTACSLQTRQMKREAWQWPFFYFTAGGLRLLLTTSEEVESDDDDTIRLVLGKTTISPHPENPICRQSVSTSSDSTWTALCPSLDSRQYEVLVRHVSISSAKFSQLVNQEVTESQILKGTGLENPALKWSQPVVSPVITPILHSVDIGCILAPAIFSCGGLASGPAAELNLLSDCSIEIGMQNLELVRIFAEELKPVFRQRRRGSFVLDEENVTCPYVLHDGNLQPDESSATVIEQTPPKIQSKSPKRNTEINRPYLIDSGVETTTSHSTYKKGRKLIPIKKLVAKPCFDFTANPSDYLEVFVTTGVIDISLYVRDDNSREVRDLRAPVGVYKKRAPKEPRIRVVIDDKNESRMDDGRVSMTTSRSLTENIRNVDIGKTKLDDKHTLPLARNAIGNLPLIHATLHQPNLYYWNRRKQKTVQVSLFNAWVGLGVGQQEDQWNSPILDTTKGTPDPVTDIPPTLATARVDLPLEGLTPLGEPSARGVVQLDVERPLMFDVCTDRIRRIKGIVDLVKKHITTKDTVCEETEEISNPFLYNVRRNLVGHRIECVIIQTNQLAIRGSEGVVGCDAVRIQLAACERPDMLTFRSLITAAVLTAGSEEDKRHVILQPLMAGILCDANWEAWRIEEGGSDLLVPTLRVGVDLDKIIFDVRPADLATAVRLYETVKEILGWVKMTPSADLTPSKDSDKSTINEWTAFSNDQSSSDNDDANNHFYKDDLRSGAFKVVSGCHQPLAYQVALHGTMLTWRYPHPRAITRLIVYPIADLKDDEIQCVLELYCPMLVRWEPQTYFRLPIKESIEMLLSSSPSEAVFAVLWRIRTCSESDHKLPFHFEPRKFMPREDPLTADIPPSKDYSKRTYNVTADQMSEVLRVDSYFGPLFLPRNRVAVRLSAMEIHAHNDNTIIPRQSSQIVEGYYVSPPLVRNHRILTLRARDSSIHCVFGSTTKLLLETYLSSDIIDSASGTMEKFINEFRAQGTVAYGVDNRIRFRVGDIRVVLHVARVSTLRSLVDDWNAVYKKSVLHIKENVELKKPEGNPMAALAGRITLWVHNNCTSVVRIAQEGTDELIPISPGASLSYRWASPGAAKRLRFSLPNTSSNWRWSKSIRFTAGSTRIRLEDKDTSLNTRGVFLHVRVTESGARRDMYLSGRLVFANLLRHDFAYKLRARSSPNSAWQIISSNNLLAESVGLSVLCDLDCEASFKVRFMSNENSWSGEIPLRECRKRNIPWLVKIPCEERAEYMSVWCRVTPVKYDGGIVSSFWPFYMIRSHLPLNIDVRISSGESLVPSAPVTYNYPLTVHKAEGRGAITHLMAPGTTSIRHKLTFQYRDIDCPVTREAVFLHYGMTERSVFDKRDTLNHIDDVINMINQWLENSREACKKWPYSIVTNHWRGVWEPAYLQPRCDVNIRYEAIRLGSGCSLELIVSPIVLLANASPILLTLRGHDGAPMCRLDPGVVIAPPTAILQKPFFMSVEIGREIFVSGKLEFCQEELGRYGQPGPGQIAFEKPATFAVQCNEKVALVTMYHEIKDDMNIVGITSTYVLINWLTTDILISALAVPNEMENAVLRPKVFKIVAPAKRDSLKGSPLSRFWMSGRWRGGEADELRAFLCVAFPTKIYQANTPVPLRLGMAPVRRSFGLKDKNGRSVPIVVTQLRHEARWIVAFSEDRCPQFVVHNHTKTIIAIAQPAENEDGTNPMKPAQDCLGVQWWCVVESNTVMHYSTPAYCARYPPPEQAGRAPTPIIIIGVSRGEGIFEWSQPIAVTNGEQLLHLSGGVTMKMRVRTQPHSTPLELQDVDQNDISASDIRRRLGKYSAESQSKQTQETQETTKVEFQRVGPNYFKNKSSRGTTDVNKDNAASTSAEESKPSTSKQVQPEYGRRKSDLARDSTMTTASTIGADDSSQMKRSESVHEDIPQAYQNELISDSTVARKDSSDFSETSYLLEGVSQKDWLDSSKLWSEKERFRCVIDNVIVSVGASSDSIPLLALHLQRLALIVQADTRMIKTTVAIADIQLDNAQYDTEQYDFAVVATTRCEAYPLEPWPALWGMFNDRIPSRAAKARLLIKTCHDRWTVANRNYQEITEVEVLLGPMGLYIEDEYVAAALELYHLAVPPSSKIQTSESLAIAEIYTLQRPLILRKLIIHPLNITLTLHTAVRMYIALDESPLRLSAFQINDAMTSFEGLKHALTVHYLSAAILGAGWVVGGLELLGAPGALASRVGNAGGGVKGVASAAAGALLRSLSSAAGSLARNLDLLAGDEDHAKRAAAARRRPPPNLMAGLVTGITNFAINILGAVGGIAHHPLVGVAVGESESGAAALRRGLVGAITKPLSATADLVAFAGHGLLSQTGWDPVPQPRATTTFGMEKGTLPSGWRRDCVRYGFRYADLGVISGFKALIDDTVYQLIITRKFLIIIDPETERLVEMLDFKNCSLGPYRGQIIELIIELPPRSPKVVEPCEEEEEVEEVEEVEEEEEEENLDVEVSAVAMARVARYTGTEDYEKKEERVITLLCLPGTAHALRATLDTVLHSSVDTHFCLL